MTPAVFKVCKTHELTKAQLQSLVRNFNTVFESNVPEANFIQQYINNSKGFSYHSFMEAEGEIVGYFSAIPFTYSYKTIEYQFCYLGGLFITPEYRKDALALFKMYKNAKDVLTAEGIAVLMAVPNKNSYPYFIHALKWIEVTTLPWHALPVRFGNIIKSRKYLNNASFLFAKAYNFLSIAASGLINKKEAKPEIFLLPKEPLMENHRYNAGHKKIKTKKFSAFYKVEDEEGVQTAYLIDFYNKDHERDSRSLALAVNYIISNEKADLILFIGPLRMHQLVLFKVPASKEPRPLNFCIEILDKKNIDEATASNPASWNFGLYNFDVR